QSAPGFSAGRCGAEAVDLQRLVEFQSAPGFSAGRCAGAADMTRKLRAFQSAPGFSAGRCRIAIRYSGAWRGFNPLPAFQPGDAHADCVGEVDVVVSIRSRLFSREMQAKRLARGLGDDVSIRSRLFSREMLRPGNHWLPKQSSIAFREPRNTRMQRGRSF